MLCKLVCVFGKKRLFLIRIVEYDFYQKGASSMTLAKQQIRQIIRQIDIFCFAGICSPLKKNSRQYEILIRRMK